ncbi:MAG: S1 RNA-binding domain-containing protein [Lachnospiraceae bacterium]|nr:S1 RNA-binding domain-containing protein [Lachnospiraceae bacterium]
MSEELKNETAKASETMADYAAELEASFRQIREGDILTGTVIDISENGILLDLKYYTDGIIHPEDFTDDPTFNIHEAVHLGDEISATVIRKDDGEGHILLSRKEANEVLAWDKLKQYLADGTNLTVKVSGIVNAGVVAYAEGIRGFIPASKLALEYVEELNDWLGKEIEVRVITADEASQRLVLSAKEILREKASADHKNLVSSIEIGLVTEGVVDSIQPYGAFVKLGNGLSGLVHISQICEKRIKSPSVVVNVGDKVKVKVIDVKDGKLSLSMKAASNDAAEEIQEETIELPESEGLSTTLSSLFKNLKFN